MIYLYSHLLYKIGLKHFTHKVGIYNVNTKLKSKCYFGYNQGGGTCKWKQIGSQLNLVYGLTHYIMLIQPILQCRTHMNKSQEAKIYLYKNQKERIYFINDDIIYNKLFFWTIPSFDSNVTNRRSINQRFHITSEGLKGLWTQRLSHVTPNNISRTFRTNYSIKIDHIISKYYKGHTYIGELESMMESCMLNPKHLENLLRGMLRGYLKPRDNEWRIAYYAHPTQELGQDATPSISKNIMGRGSGIYSFVFAFVFVYVFVFILIYFNCFYFCCNI